MFTLYISVYIVASLSIISGPSPVTVPVHENATFQCIASNCTSILWELNGTTISSGSWDINYTDSYDQYDNFSFQFISKLIIPITDDNRIILNYGWFTCIAVNKTISTDPSEPAILTIQGIHIAHKHTHITHTHM